MAEDPSPNIHNRAHHNGKAQVDQTVGRGRHLRLGCRSYPVPLMQGSLEDTPRSLDICDETDNMQVAEAAPYILVLVRSPNSVVVPAADEPLSPGGNWVSLEVFEILSCFPE